MSYYYYKEFDKIELHFWLEDGLHTMDAFVQNKCELEFLNIAREVAKLLGHDISIETEALAEGGIKRWFNIIKNNENNNAPITLSVITLIIASIIIKPLDITIDKIIDKLFEDKEMIELDKDKKRFEIENLKLDIQEKSKRIEKNNKIKKLKSNFFRELEKDSRIIQFSILIEDNLRIESTNEYKIDVADFKKFHQHDQLKQENIQQNSEKSSKYLIQETFEVSEKIQNANIEIVSPDFSPNSDNWKGVYDGKHITFKIIYENFNNQVQSGVIKFRKGTILNCLLSIKRLSSRVIIYEILEVNNYSE